MRDRNDRNNDYGRRDFRHGAEDERMTRGEDQRFHRGPQGEQADFSPRYDRDQGDFEQRRYDQDNRFQSNRGWEGQQRNARGRGFEDNRMQDRNQGDPSFQERGYQSYPENWGYQGRTHERSWGNPGYQDRGVQGSNYGGQGGYGQSWNDQGHGGFQGNQGNQRGWGAQDRAYEGSYGNQSGRDAQGRGFGGGYGGDWRGQGNRDQHFGSSGETNYGNPNYGNQNTKGRAPRGYKRSDERIQDDICDRLMQDGRVDASDVEVKVSNGEVTLTGTIESRAIKHQIENMIDAVSGVQEIHNQLRIKRMDQAHQASDDRGMNDKASMGKSGQGTGATATKNSNEPKRDQERHAS
jgi:osmotically-inducible protein OsmY